MSETNNLIKAGHPFGDMTVSEKLSWGMGLLYPRDDEDSTMVHDILDDAKKKISSLETRLQQVYMKLEMCEAQALEQLRSGLEREKRLEEEIRAIKESRDG